jgi:HSP20 family protein
MNEQNQVATREQTTPVQTAKRMRVVAPLVDIYENEDELLLQADVPGVAKEDVNVRVDNGTLTVSATRRVNGDGNAQWLEFGEAEYRRSFSVPQTIAVDKVRAELKDGVLTLHLPKSESAKPKQIEIKAA